MNLNLLSEVNTNVDLALAPNDKLFKFFFDNIFKEPEINSIGKDDIQFVINVRFGNVTHYSVHEFFFIRHILFLVIIFNRPIPNGIEPLYVFRLYIKTIKTLIVRIIISAQTLYQRLLVYII